MNQKLQFYMKMINIGIMLLLVLAASCQIEETEMGEDDKTKLDTEILYIMPDETERHEGTWLQWPHHYQYGKSYRDNLDATWIEMTKALLSGENVHVIVYNSMEKNRIAKLLEKAKVSLTKIDFFIFKTDDVWVRDNGPVYVRDIKGKLCIEDWGFNGWGNKVDDITGKKIASSNCNAIPSKIGGVQNKIIVDLKSMMINEGGSIEMDGQGTLLACKSSILNSNRNPGLTSKAAEIIFKKYLGVSNFIWLTGRAGFDITDQHIDGFAKFGNSKTIVTMNDEDLKYYLVQDSDIKKLRSAKNINGVGYEFLEVPLTKYNVVNTDGVDLGYKGSYINYYIANDKILVPNYSDPNDNLANEIIQTLYPHRKVVGIDVRNLYQNGGMVHCVTQQQPME